MFPYKELLDQLDRDLSEASGLPVDSFQEDTPLSDWSDRQAACWSLRRSFYKKLAPSGISKVMIERSLEKFLSINRSMTQGVFEFDAQSWLEAAFWQTFKDYVHKTLYTPPTEAGLDLTFVSDHFAAGPGAALKSDSRCFYTKLFAGKISATHPYLFALYRAAIFRSNSWVEAERLRHETFGEEIVPGNRLFFVPKTTEIARTCCTEATVNMLLQKAVGAFFEERLLERFGISLRTQPDLNRELARIGSINGRFGTIDLQSASDSISLSLCEALLPNQVKAWVKLTRSPYALLPNGQKEELRMVSTMGNGFTFPLQTILFACAVRTVYTLFDLPERDDAGKREWGVFGDDIIVRREAYEFVCKMLQKLGFRVNDTKSYNSGGFRESCGYDWRNGYFIRGVYITSLESISDLFSAVNRLNRWSAVHRVPLPHTIGMLIKRLSRGQRRMLVPPSESVDAGVQVPFTMIRNTRVDDLYRFSYTKLIPVQPKIRSDELGEAGDGKFKNPYGLWITVLGGHARRSERHLLEPEDVPPWEGVDTRSYPELWMSPRKLQGQVLPRKRVRAYIPWWDWRGPEREVINRSGLPHEDEGSPYDDNQLFFDHAAWKAAVEANAEEALGH